MFLACDWNLISIFYLWFFSPKRVMWMWTLSSFIDDYKIDQCIFMETWLKTNDPVYDATCKECCLMATDFTIRVDQ